MSRDFSWLYGPEGEETRYCAICRDPFLSSPRPGSVQVALDQPKVIQAWDECPTCWVNHMRRLYAELYRHEAQQRGVRLP